MVVCSSSYLTTLSHSWRPSRRCCRDRVASCANLLVGTILSPVQRTVSSALRTVGLRHVRTFQAYHRVLNRAVWSSRAASRILLRLLLATFAPQGLLVLGIDETIERRRGQQIAAAGIYRDPVRFSYRGGKPTGSSVWI